MARSTLMYHHHIATVLQAFINQPSPTDIRKSLHTMTQYDFHMEITLCIWTLIYMAKYPHCIKSDLLKCEVN